MQICWSCQLRACDAKSLRILAPSRDEVILDLQRSRQRPNSKSASAALFFLDWEIVLPRAFIAQFWSFYCTANSEPFALVFRFGTPWTASSWDPRVFPTFRPFSSLSFLNNLTSKFQLQDQNILNWIQRLHPGTHRNRFPLIGLFWIASYWLDRSVLNWIQIFKLARSVLRFASRRCKSNR